MSFFCRVIISQAPINIIFYMDPIDLEWKIIYVGSAESDAHDQVLDSVLVGPVPMGRHKFVFQVLVQLYYQKGQFNI